MLLANMIVGKVMVNVNKENAVLRRHEAPTDRKIDFMDNLTKFIISFKKKINKLIFFLFVRNFGIKLNFSSSK